MTGWSGDPRTTAERARAALYMAATDEAWRYVRTHPHRFRLTKPTFDGRPNPQDVHRVVADMLPFPEELRATLEAIHAERYAARYARL